MKSTRTRSLLPLLGAVGLGVCLWSPAPTARAHDGHEATSRWPAGNQYQRSVRTYAVPDVQLSDADGKAVRLRDLLATSDPVMLNFIFTTCNTACPIMVKVFADLPSRLGSSGEKLRMISISIDPDNDTPAQLRSYAKSFGAGAQWKFLTGRVQDVKAVQMAFDGYRGDKMNHEPLTLMRHAPGKSWVRIDGFASPDDLAREYRKPAPP